MEVSQIRGTFLGSLFQENPAIWGSILGGPDFRKLPERVRI